jgi:hypothetical protein
MTGPSDTSADDSRLDALLPPEMARRAEEVGARKAALDTASTFTLAVLAGALIALGGVFATTALPGAGTAPWSATLGLILVLVGGAELFKSRRTEDAAPCALEWPAPPEVDWMVSRRWTSNGQLPRQTLHEVPDQGDPDEPEGTEPDEECSQCNQGPAPQRSPPPHRSPLALALRCLELSPDRLPGRWSSARVRPPCQLVVSESGEDAWRAQLRLGLERPRWGGDVLPSAGNPPMRALTTHPLGPPHPPR